MCLRLGDMASQMSSYRDLGQVRCLAMYQAGRAGLQICMSLMHNKRIRVSGAARGMDRGNDAAAGAQEVTA
jgi:hypothetical protein